MPRNVRCMGCAEERVIAMLWQITYTSGQILVHPFCASCAGPRYAACADIPIQQATKFICNQIFESAFSGAEEAAP